MRSSYAASATASSEAVRLTERWMRRRLQRAAYLASSELAAEKGAFPLFDKEKYLAGESVAALDADVRGAIAAHGIRNSLLTSVAPTGTISLFADNVSSGLEPVFSFKYTRKRADAGRHAQGGGGRRLRATASSAASRARMRRSPSISSNAQTLSPADHVVMQAAVQKYGRQLDLEDDQRPGRDLLRGIQGRLYPGLRARLQRLHDLPAERDHRRRARGEEGGGAPASGAQAELPLPAPAAPVRPADIYEAGRRRLHDAAAVAARGVARPDLQDPWPDGDHAIYITINDIIQDGRKRPFEIFIIPRTWSITPGRWA